MDPGGPRARTSMLARAWLGDRPTVGRFLVDALRPPRASAGEPLEAFVDVPDRGRLRLTATLRDVPGSRALFVLVHGLGGSERSTYVLRSARAFAELGHATLGINLRGADHAGEDFYNVALVEDLEAWCAHPRLARYERLHVIGYSMGGYNTLHHARAPRDPRVKASVALCTPLDLKDAQLHFDAAPAFLYRRHVLGGLKAIYAAIARQGNPLPSPLADVLAVRTIREWDRLTVAPRYGYANPEAYYDALSIRPHLASLAIPVLHVHAPHDPVIPPSTILPHLPSHLPPHLPPHHAIELRTAPKSGHLAFEPALDLGAPAAVGLEHQVAHWCLSR